MRDLCGDGIVLYLIVVTQFLQIDKIALTHTNE